MNVDTSPSMTSIYEHLEKNEVVENEDEAIQFWHREDSSLIMYKALYRIEYLTPLYNNVCHHPKT